MANSIEEKVEGYYKNLLNLLGVRHYAKTEEINSKITEALKNSVSKGGGSGMNYSDMVASMTVGSVVSARYFSLRL